MGGVLSGGLEGDDAEWSACAAKGVGVAVTVTSVSECGLVVWRVAGDWGGGYEQLSANDGLEWREEPDKGVRVGGADIQCEYIEP